MFAECQAQLENLTMWLEVKMLQKAKKLVPEVLQEGYTGSRGQYLRNYSKSIRARGFGDSFAILQVLNSLDKEKCSLAPLAESDPLKKAEGAIRNAELLGVPPLIRGADITSGNVKLLTVFVAEMFNTRHGLEELNEEEMEAYEKAGIIDDDVEGSRDERAFRFWINSLGIDDVYIQDLIEDFKTGIVPLKIIDKIKPGVVNFKTVDKNPNNPYKKGINCGQIIDAAKKIKYLKRETKSNRFFKRGKTKRRDDENVGGFVKISLPTVKIDQY